MERIAESLSLLCSPALLEFWRDKGRAWGPVWSGALYGAGIWFWVDAVACSSSKIPFSQYLPAIIATFALIMINSVRRDELDSYDAFDEGVYCRARFWLLSAYIISVGAILGSVIVMLHYYGLAEGDRWPGLANVFSVACILGSALLFFMSRTPGEEGGGGYTGF